MNLHFFLLTSLFVYYITNAFSACAMENAPSNQQKKSPNTLMNICLTILKAQKKSNDYTLEQKRALYDTIIQTNKGNLDERHQALTFFHIYDVITIKQFFEQKPNQAIIKERKPIDLYA